MQKEKIGIVGVGHLGVALHRGLAAAGYRVLLNNGCPERTQEKMNEAELENACAATLQEIAANCSMLFLCIKHTQLAEVGCELNRLLNDKHIVISCLAQATLAEVESVLRYADPLVVKVMTTLGVQNNQGVSAYQLAEATGAYDDFRLKEVMAAVSASGCVFELETEEQMQLFTVSVGCFPGILAHFLDQFSWSIGHRGGTTFENYGATLPVLLRATADLLDTEGSARVVRNKVATKGGVTQATIMGMSSSGLTRALDDGVSSGLKKMKKPRV